MLDTRHRDRNAPAPMLGLGFAEPFAFIPSEEAKRVADAERADEEKADAPNGSWENLILATSDFVTDDSEKSQRARRAVHDLVGPWIPDDAWRVSLALGRIYYSLLYSSRPGSARRRKLLQAVYEEAISVGKELGEKEREP